jgi:hypothetical protein
MFNLKTFNHMKTVGLFLIMFFFGTNAFAQMTSSLVKVEEAKAAISWNAQVVDLGKIDQGKPETAVFSFTNIGKTPLLITAVQASCGCTTPEYSKEPIAPGKSGFVKATYNAANQGAFNKTVMVTTNQSEGPISLVLKGEVVTK